jgi:hypothetical protein
MSTPSDLARPLRLPGYVVTAVLTVLPMGEVAVNAWPPRWHEPPWRMAMVASTTSAATTMIFALFLLLVIGVLAGDRPIVWLVATTSTVAVLLSIAGAGAFALDSVQVRSQLQASQVSRYAAQSLWALAKIGVGGIGFFVLAFSALRAVRKQRPPARATSKRVPLMKPTPGRDPTERTSPSPAPLDGATSPSASL